MSIHSSRRTFDRRLLKTISTDIKQRITAMGYLFVTDDLADPPSITATDSTLIKAKDSVWHKSSIMKKGEVPCSAVLTRMHEGGIIVIPRRDGWIQTTSNMYNSRGDLIVPL